MNYELSDELSCELSDELSLLISLDTCVIRRLSVNHPETICTA